MSAVGKQKAEVSYFSTSIRLINGGSGSGAPPSFLLLIHHRPKSPALVGFSDKSQPSTRACYFPRISSRGILDRGGGDYKYPGPENNLWRAGEILPFGDDVVFRGDCELTGVLAFSHIDLVQGVPGKPGPESLLSLGVAPLMLVLAFQAAAVPESAERASGGRCRDRHLILSLRIGRRRALVLVPASVEFGWVLLGVEEEEASADQYPVGEGIDFCARGV